MRQALFDFIQREDIQLLGLLLKARVSWSRYQADHSVTAADVEVLQTRTVGLYGKALFRGLGHAAAVTAALMKRFRIATSS